MRDRKSNIAPSFTVMHVALLLLCAVLLTAHATTGLYASYKSEASGSDSARVAKFQLTSGFSATSPVDFKLNFYDPNMLSDEISITVSSQSEVSVYYDVVITMPEAATYDWLIVTLDGEQPSRINKNVFTFSLVNTFAPGATCTSGAVMPMIFARLSLCSRSLVRCRYSVYFINSSSEM